MAFRNQLRAEGVFSLNLTPLLDVVLQLITFFMMLIHFGNKIEGETAAIKLPTAPAALPGGDLGLDRLVVGVDAQGNLIAEDSRITPDSTDAGGRPGR
jgi:biopolymer transport protein ExbD